MILCVVTSCPERYKNPVVAEMKQSSLNVFGVPRMSLESCSLCELVSCETLSAIVRANTVIICDLLSAGVVNFCKCRVFLLPALRVSWNIRE
ncbi:hypothetical protein AVEN_159215-1 [Araneus ventricosus]|uniref:Uncharacterized protein n=1 Tax=Araneus ventricosus TaxID=182803 RepID=A0A4Y2A0Q1_ARAVE|nr:hypothetical protein AVEN_159215-1 [Araneus ventricosus]